MLERMDDDIKEEGCDGDRDLRMLWVIDVGSARVKK